MSKNPKGGNVIKGPWPDKVKPSDVDGMQVIEDLKFADDLTEAILVQMLTTFRDNNLDTKNKEFGSDIAFIIEVVKSIIYRSMGYDHPLHNFMGGILDVTEVADESGVHYDTILNTELLQDVSDFVSIALEENDDDDGPEKA